VYTGGAAAYRHLNEQQRHEKQKAAHELGAAALGKVAQEIGIFTSKGKPAWTIVAAAGGAAAFKGASAQESADLVAKGLANMKDSAASSLAVRVDLVHAAQNIETERFERILTTTGAMEHREAQKWLNNPTTTLGRNAGQVVRAAIHLDAIRAMATEEYGRPLSDKEWATISQEKKWKKCQSSQHMTVELAAKRATKIFDILLKAPIQVAKNYMAATIILRQKNTANWLARPNKS
jgi:hypothetical protein